MGSPAAENTMAETDPLRSLDMPANILAMPFYRFLIHGRDSSLPPDTKGFFTTRHAFAATEERAAQKVFDRLTREFTIGVSAHIWRSGPPVFSIEQAYRIGLHQLRSAPNKGSTFYGDVDL
jgi:hypothetical protein